MLWGADLIVLFLQLDRLVQLGVLLARVRAKRDL